MLSSPHFRFEFTTHTVSRRVTDRESGPALTKFCLLFTLITYNSHMFWELNEKDLSMLHVPYGIMPMITLDKSLSKILFELSM